MNELPSGGSHFEEQDFLHVTEAVVEPKIALLIDPDSEIRENLSRILAYPQWRIQIASDNAAALALKATRFDLVVTAKRSSGKNDVELLREIKGFHPHAKVIILTDESTPQDALDAMRLGAFSYFSKPIYLPALGQMVRDAIDGACLEDGIEVQSANLHSMKFVLRCDVISAERLLQFVNEVADLPDQEKTIVASALRELLMNAIEYGGNFDPQRHVEMSYLRTRRAVACRIKDPGEGFSLHEIPHAAVMNPPDDPLRHLTVREAENRRPGGYGVLLARKAVDQLIYNEKGNEVLLIKYIDQEGHAHAPASSAHTTV